MQNKQSVYLEFDPQFNQIGDKKELRHGLSVVAQIGSTLWLTNDETISLERLSFQEQDADGNYKYGNHQQFSLTNLLSLPVQPDTDKNDGFEEADLEGLTYHDGYLWLVGSHSLKRSKTKKEASDEENLESLSKISYEGNRFLLARIPVEKQGDSYTVKKKVKEKGETRLISQLKTNATGNDLTKKLKKDPLLKEFLMIPGKDNGFDIEGIAIWGETVFLGLRGPVLRGWAIVLALEVKETRKKGVAKLKLKKIKKYFLQLGGLGVRDLFIQGSDILILAGPTMSLDGPVSILRWKDGVQTEKRFVFQEELELIKNVPFGQGNDHAEGMTLFSNGEDNANSIMVVYDAACNDRLCGTSSVKADIFGLE